MSQQTDDFAKWFPHRVCINLDRRPERWQRMQSRAGSAGLGPLERFAAVDGAAVTPPPGWPETRGAYGCLSSHLAVIQRAKREGWPHVLILEDDVLLEDGFLEKFRERIVSVPDDWDMLFFGCLHHDLPKPVAPGIARLRGSFSTFMYAVRATAYDGFIRLNTRAKKAVDTNNTILQRCYKCYCFMPHLAWVDDSPSDAQNLPSHHWYIRDSLVLRGKEVEAMEKRTAIVIPYHPQPNPEIARRNLDFLIRHYGGLFAVLVVEYGREPSLDIASLPEGCGYRLLESDGLLRPERCLVEAKRCFAEEKDFFIFNEANVVCSRMEMRANLIKCAEYDAVTSFRSYIDLDAVDTERFVKGEDYTADNYLPRPRVGCYSEYVTFSRRGLSRYLENGAPGSSERLEEERVFDSPGCAIRLFSGDERPIVDEAGTSACGLLVEAESHLVVTEKA